MENAEELLEEITHDTMKIEESRNKMYRQQARLHAESRRSSKMDAQMIQSLIHSGGQGVSSINRKLSVVREEIVVPEESKADSIE